MLKECLAAIHKTAQKGDATEPSYYYPALKSPWKRSPMNRDTLRWQFSMKWKNTAVSPAIQEGQSIY